MKLGIVIKITNSGVSEAYSINKNEEWARYAGDVRPAINILNGFDGSGKSVILAKFLGGLGYLLCLIKARPEGSGRGGDNVSAWIHIPSNCDLSNSEVVNLLVQVESAISASTGIDIKSLNDLFQKEYFTNNVMISASSRIVSSNNNGFAIRYYNNGEYNLKELLGSKIAQREYSSYQSILFVDKQIEITPQGEVLNFEPKDICTYTPIAKIDGFIPCFPSNGGYVPFDRAIEVPKGEQATIHWYKEGYAIIKKSFLAGDDLQYPQIVLINPSEYKIIVKRDHFHIYDPNNVPVKNPDISIDGMLMTGDSLELSETSYNEGVRLLIRAKGLADYRKDKEKLSRNMQIFMGHHFYHYDFEIPLRVGEEKLGHAVFSIETNHKLKHCPIEGYETEDYNLYESNRDVNRLCKSSDWKTKAKFFLYGIATVIVAMLLVAAYNALDNYEFRLGWPPFKEIKQEKAALSTRISDNTQTQETADVELKSAINYLDSSEVWEKGKLDSYEATRGVFEALNSFDLDALKQRKERNLYASKKYSEIVQMLKDYTDARNDPHIGKEDNGGFYNNENDKSINVENYKKWLLEEHTPTHPHADVVEMPKVQSGKITGSKTKDVQTLPTPKKGEEKKVQSVKKSRKINES